MAGQVHFRLAEQPDGFVDVVAPQQGVAHLGAAQRVKVVHIVRRDFRAVEGAGMRQVKGQFGRRLRAWCVLENELESVDQ